MPRTQKKLGDIDPNTALQMRLIGMDQKIADLTANIVKTTQDVATLTNLVNSLATQLKLNAGAISGCSNEIKSVGDRVTALETAKPSWFSFLKRK